MGIAALAQPQQARSRVRACLRLCRLDRNDLKGRGFSRAN